MAVKRKVVIGWFWNVDPIIIKNYCTLVGNRVQLHTVPKVLLKGAFQLIKDYT
jgi:hypothetical protein